MDVMTCVCACMYTCVSVCLTFLNGSIDCIHPQHHFTVMPSENK